MSSEKRLKSACAVCEDREEEIGNFRRREKRSVEIVQEGQQAIEKLEEEINGHEREQRDIRRRLAEAEKKAEERQIGLQKAATETTDEDIQRKNKKRGQNNEGRRAGGTVWEFRRRKGMKATPSGAIRQMVFAVK